jgi:hypothetical protein
VRSSEVERFEQLVDEGAKTEEAAREALSSSRTLLRECLRQSDAVRTHLGHMKELQVHFKSHATGGNGFALDHFLEQQLDQNIKLVGWLVRFWRLYLAPMLGTSY